MQILIRYVILSAALFYFHSSVTAQSSFAIYAKIVDGKSGLPIPFATIKVMNGKLLVGGVISNGDGDFQIPSKYRSTTNNIVISCIGYSNRTMKMDELLPDRVNMITLNVTSLQLREVVITPQRQVKLTANRIVQLAIQNIPKNNPTHPFSYIAYYRDYQREENDYVNLNEGIVGIYDQGFDANDFLTTKLKLHQFRLNKNFKRDSVTAIAYDNNSHGNKFIPTAKVTPFGGNELSQLMIHDAVRNYKANSYSFVNEFSSDFTRNHSFKLLETVLLGEVPLYHIGFQTLYFVTRGEHVGRGDIFIEHGTYAIHKLIYSTYLKESGKDRLLYSIQEEYTKTDSLMYLNYISFNNFFKAREDGFEVLDVALDLAANSFVITFNHKPDRISALEPKNYHFRFDKKHFEIDHIALSDSEEKKVFVVLKQNQDFSYRNEKVTSLSARIHSDLKNIKDEKGNLVGEVKYKLVNQFRELFLQKLSQAARPSLQGPFIAKETPLQKNQVDSLRLASSNYWMNTPLRNGADWEEREASAQSPAFQQLEQENKAVEIS